MHHNRFRLRYRIYQINSSPHQIHNICRFSQIIVTMMTTMRSGIHRQCSQRNNTQKHKLFHFHLLKIKSSTP